jgi:hypothetical protein
MGIHIHAHVHIHIDVVCQKTCTNYTRWHCRRQSPKRHRYPRLCHRGKVPLSNLKRDVRGLSFVVCADFLLPAIHFIHLRLSSSSSSTSAHPISHIQLSLRSQNHPTHPTRAEKVPDTRKETPKRQRSKTPCRQPRATPFLCPTPSLRSRGGSRGSP